MTRQGWNTVYIVTAVIMLAILGGIVASVPRTEDGFDWFGQMIEGGWMAWSFPIAFFFWVIAVTLIVFTFLAVRFPETPRVGILRIETTRGDRLFITLLGSAFINLAWLGFEFEPQWLALIPCAVWAFIVFRWV